MNIYRPLISVLALTVAVCSSSHARAMSMEQACGDASGSLAMEPAGRWLPWADDSVANEGLDSALLERQRDLLTELVKPFIQLPLLGPPRGVELRPSRSLGIRASLGEPGASAELLIQIFHPTYERALETSTFIKISVNNLLPLFYGIGGGKIKDDAGSMFAEPIRVGELGGAEVYWSERPKDCIAVFRRHQNPLWKPVSQERYLRAQIHALEHKIDAARNEFLKARKKQKSSTGGANVKQQEELITQLEATNPEMAKEMRKRFAALRKQMTEKKSEMMTGADSDLGRMDHALFPEVKKIKAELAAMTPAERSSPAYLGGAHGSKTTLLSRPDDKGARALVAPASDYFSEGKGISSVQLLTIEFAGHATHTEAVIMTRMRREMDWTQFRRFTHQQ